MTTNTEQQKQQKQKQDDEVVWSLTQQSATTDDPIIKESIRQIYGEVADLYHEYRPKYPKSLIDKAITHINSIPKIADTDQSSKPSRRPKLLEIGCGPGTLTLDLLKRNKFDIIAIDPGTSMIDKAKEICLSLTTDDNNNNNNVKIEFQNVAFKDFNDDEKFDAIIAASSLHWALAEGGGDSTSSSSEEQQTTTTINPMIQKLYNHLETDYDYKDNTDEDDGDSHSPPSSSSSSPSCLFLFWNFPPEPNNTKILDKIADALQKPKPFHFGNGNLYDHERRLTEKVLKPIEDSKLFTKFITTEICLVDTFTVKAYVGYLQTLSNYIVMPQKEKELFFNTVEQILLEECDNNETKTIETTRKSILNISYAVCKEIKRIP